MSNSMFRCCERRRMEALRLGQESLRTYRSEGGVRPDEGWRQVGADPTGNHSVSPVWEAGDLKSKLEKSEAEIEAGRKANELNLLPFSSSSKEIWMDSLEPADMEGLDRAIVPKIPAGVSGTALAASLLRDGWSLAKMYAKYQEAVDALRHEQLGRKESEAILQRVLYEIEEKAEVSYTATSTQAMGIPPVSAQCKICRAA